MIFSTVPSLYFYSSTQFIPISRKFLPCSFCQSGLAAGLEKFKFCPADSISVNLKLPDCGGGGSSAEPCLPLVVLQFGFNVTWFDSDNDIAFRAAGTRCGPEQPHPANRKCHITLPFTLHAKQRPNEEKNPKIFLPEKESISGRSGVEKLRLFDIFAKPGPIQAFSVYYYCSKFQLKLLVG